MPTSQPTDIERYARDIVMAAYADEVEEFAAGDPPRLFDSRAVRYFREKAFWVTGVIIDEILAAAKLVLLRALKQDKTSRQVLHELDSALNEWLPERDSAGRAVNVPHRIETIARTNLSEAINEGRWAQFTDPDVEGFVTGFEYSAVLDNRTRSHHAAWNGVKMQKDDPRWFGPPDRRPPNGFSCRCVLIPITVADPQEWTPEDAMPTVEVVDDGFE